MENKRIIGVFDDEKNLFDSIDLVQEKGYKISDVITPFAIETIFEKLKLKTRINVAAYFYGAIGGVLGIFLALYYIAVISYPYNIGGKPTLSLSFIILMFVGTILVVVISTLMTFFIRDKKGPGAKEHFQYEGITDDRFLILIERTPDLSAEDVNSINAIMMGNGALKIDEQ